ncbi:hypothetical protein N0V83_009202 [Neocucurbitaria cava]|uniref:Uncharacterized protein n=1 Tax=Neocucurbitaria cava TaxID=798079 RepID=A0A9W9CIV5_9PLEO|nr:hypothetical protein N0V83_009202 [Neocucurbitaria cava]
MCKGHLTTPNGGVLETLISVAPAVSRAGFGITIQVPWDEKNYPGEDKVWNKDEHVWKASNQMSWYLKRGENVSKKAPIRSTFYRTYRKHPGHNFSLQLLQCEDPVAPERRTESVVSLYHINCLNNKPFSAFEDFFELEMVPSGAAVEFVPYFDGKRQETQNAKMVFQ